MNRLVGWIDARFPLISFWEEHVSRYYAPKNFNFWYYFGSIALVVLVIQIVTGIWLTMNYKPSATEAFASVESIMRDVEWDGSSVTCIRRALRSSSSPCTCTCSGRSSTAPTRGTGS